MSEITFEEELDQLCDAFMGLEDKEECKAFLQDLCTKKELSSISQRVEIAKQLQARRTYNAIAEATQSSTATISRINRAVNDGHNGYDKVLRRLRGVPMK